LSKPYISGDTVIAVEDIAALGRILIGMIEKADKGLITTARDIGGLFGLDVHIGKIGAISRDHDLVFGKFFGRR